MHPILNNVERTLQPFFKNFPALPKATRDVLATISPLATLVVGLLMAFDIFNALNWLRYGLFIGGGSLTPFYLAGVLVSVAAGVAFLIASTELLHRTRKGWELAFLGTTLQVVAGALFVFSSIRYFSLSPLLYAAVTALIGYYFLFQLKDDLDKKSKPTPKKGK